MLNELGFNSSGKAEAEPLRSAFEDSVTDSTLSSVVDDHDNVIGVWLLSESHWDTEHFGIKIGKTKVFLYEDLLPLRHVTAMAKIGIERSKERGLKLIVSRINSRRAKAIQSLESLGAFTTDTVVKLRGQANRIRPEAPKGVTVDDAIEGSLSQIAEISRSAFSFGHFYNNPLLPREVIDEMYARWAISHLHDRDYKLHVARNRRRIIGFILSRLEDGPMGERHGVIDLLAVSPEFRNMKVGSSLIDHGMNWFSQHAKSVFVVTQSYNLAALNLYVRKGFTIVSSEITLHHWL